MEKLNDSAVISVTSAPEVQRYDNGATVLIDSRRAAWLKTSWTGQVIFESLQRQPMSVRDVVALVSSKYSLPKDMIEESTLSFVHALIEEGFATVSGSGCCASTDALDSRYGNDHLRAEGLQSLCIAITGACNLRCKQCYYDKTDSFMSLETARRVIAEAAAMNVKVLTVFGGEPFLHPQLIDLLKCCREASDWDIRLITNGQFDDDAVRLHAVADLVDQLSVSLDGITPTTHDSLRGAGTFARAVNTLKILAELNTRAKRCISFTPVPGNEEEILGLLNLSLSLKVSGIHLNVPRRPAVPAAAADLLACGFLSERFYETFLNNHSKLVLEVSKLFAHPRAAVSLKDVPSVDVTSDPTSELLTTVRRTSCGAAATQLFVNCDGNCYPCPSLCRPDCILGNIAESSLAEIHGGSEPKAFRCRVSVENIPQCKDCTYRFWCAGGCRALAADPEQPTPFCELNKGRFATFLESVRLPQTRFETATRENSGARRLECKA